MTTKKNIILKVKRKFETRITKLNRIRIKIKKIKQNYNNKEKNTTFSFKRLCWKKEKDIKMKRRRSEQK